MERLKKGAASQGRGLDKRTDEIHENGTGTTDEAARGPGVQSRRVAARGLWAQCSRAPTSRRVRPALITWFPARRVPAGVLHTPRRPRPELWEPQGLSPALRLGHESAAAPAPRVEAPGLSPRPGSAEEGREGPS